MTATALAPTRAKRPKRMRLAEARRIAGVVLGEYPAKLDREGRTLALSAMNALGYSNEYMAEQLGLTVPTSVWGTASALGVKLDRRRDFVDEGAIAFILQGTPMPVTDRTLDAAIIRLAARGKTCVQIAHLTRKNPSSITGRADDLEVDLPAEVYECWWSKKAPKQSSTNDQGEPDHDA